MDWREFERWMKSAERTLESARRDLAAGDYNWACFKAQQAAEKALKALLWGVGEPRPGHSLPQLAEAIEALGIDVPPDVKERCYRLSKFYVPTRYPDAWSEGAPEDYYSRGEAEEAIKMASGVVEWAEEVWRELSRRGGG